MLFLLRGSLPIREDGPDKEAGMVFSNLILATIIVLAAERSSSD